MKDINTKSNTNKKRAVMSKSKSNSKKISNKKESKVTKKIKLDDSQINDLKVKATNIKKQNEIKNISKKLKVKESQIHKIKKGNNIIDKTSNLFNNDNNVSINKKTLFNVAEVIVIMIISITFGAIIGGTLTYTKKSISTNKSSSELNEFIDTYNNIVNNYYKSVDKSKLIDSAIEGMVNSLDDSYSTYFNSSDAEEFNETVEGIYGGIGATVSSIDGSNVIVSIFNDSPAFKSGLMVGDIFKKVDKTDVSSYNLEKLTELIKGKKNTKIKVVVLRDNKLVTLNIIRDDIIIPSAFGEIIKNNDINIGYISLTSFSSNTYEQFKTELTNLEKKKFKSLIIDLRDNPGGHLNQVTNILSLFLPKSKILYQLETKGVKEPVYSLTKQKRNYQVVVLINGGSASASEIMAACFKESYDNSVIIGVNSYGKGTVQQAYDLSSGSSLKFTVQKWLTPNGNWINEKGVSPDIDVKLTTDYYSNPTDENDTQLQKAFEIINNKESTN